MLPAAPCDFHVGCCCRCCCCGRFVSCRRGCNKVDEVLYRHYERNFEELVLALPPSKSQRAGTMLDDLPEAKVFVIYICVCTYIQGPPSRGWYLFTGVTQGLEDTWVTHTTRVGWTAAVYSPSLIINRCCSSFSCTAVYN